jgi:stage V sporulation protein G
MREMNITDVRIRKITTENRMKALASITLEGCFVIHDLRIIQGDEHLFVAMPSRKVNNGEFRDIAHPINHEMRKELEKFVIDAYKKMEAQVI